MPVEALIGLQRGDEGKGRFVDLIAPDYDIVARGNGGANAGHTFVPKNGTEAFVTNLLPSGIAHKGILNVLGQGVYIDPVCLKGEILGAQKRGFEATPNNLLVSNIAHLVMPHHILLDIDREEGDGDQGSTRRGIAFVAEEKYLREGVRIDSVMGRTHEELEALAFDLSRKTREDLNDIREMQEEFTDDERKIVEAYNDTNETKDQVSASTWASSINFLSEYLADTRQIFYDRLAAGDRILAEGAQSHWLDIDHGAYPNVTSSHTTVTGLLGGLGIAPHELEKTIGVAKLINSHVGGGKMMTEIEDELLAAHIRGDKRDIDSEHGSTTARDRRIGFLDLVQINTAVKFNGVNELFLSKLDHFPRYGGEKVGVAVGYRYGSKHFSIAPSSVPEMHKARVDYDMFDLWTEDVSVRRNYAMLPDSAKKLVEEIETFVERPVTKIGVGPQHDQVINK